jgi:hypothetical protein
LIHDRGSFLADKGLSRTAIEGVVVATRVFPFEDFIMTSGAGLPAGADVLTKMKGLLKRWARSSPKDLDELTREESAQFNGEAIALCLKGKEADRISYEGPREAPRERPAPLVAGSPAGRNDACPCGSGKKYKKCCGQ